MDLKFHLVSLPLIPVISIAKNESIKEEQNEQKNRSAVKKNLYVNYPSSSRACGYVDNSLNQLNLFRNSLYNFVDNSVDNFFNFVDNFHARRINRVIHKLSTQNLWITFLTN